MNNLHSRLNHYTKYLLFVGLLTFSFYSLLLALISIDNNELWVDEIYSIAFSSSSQKAVHNNILNPQMHYPVADYQKYLDSSPSLSALIDIPQRLSNAGETHPPLYYLTLNMWSTAFGHSKIAVRALSLLFALLCLLLAFRIGQFIHGTRFGLILASTFPLCFHFLHHLTIARMHMLTLLLTLCCAYYFIRHNWPSGQQKSGDDKNIYALSFFLALGCLNSFLFFHICIAVAVGSLLFKLSLKTLIKVFSIPFVTFTAFLVLGGYRQLKNMPYSDFMSESLTLMSFIENSLIRLSPFESLYRSSPVPQALTIALLFTVMLVPLFFEKAQRKLFISFALVPIVTTFLFDLFIGSSLSLWAEARAVNFLVVGLALGFAITIYQMKNFALNLFATYFIYVIFVGNAWHTHHYFFSPGVSFEQMKSEVSKSFNQEMPILFLTDTDQSYHVPIKLLIYFKDYHNSHIYHLQDFSSKEDISSLIEKSEFVVYLSHSLSRLSQPQKDQLKQWFELKGYQQTFSFPSKGIWGPWEDYDWHLYGRERANQ